MRKLGTIQCLEVLSNDNSAHKNLMILFHGFGADAYDLQTLSDVIVQPQPTDYLFPQGPLEVPIGPGWTGRAWWQIDMAALQAANVSGAERKMEDEHPEGLRTLRPKIFAMIEQTRVPWSQIIIGGFSQGAMLATDIFLRAPHAPRALVVLSGALICQDEWKALAPQRAGCKFFQSHGQMDQVLPFKGASRLETVLTGAGVKGRLLGFPGGHEIPPVTIAALNQFLATT